MSAAEYNSPDVSTAVAVIGLRYVRSRAQKFFVSFLTWIAAIGVGSGVVALIVVLSVMNGFENDIRDRLVALSAHARLQPLAASADLGALASMAATLRKQAGVTGVAPFVQLEAIAVNGAESQPLMLLGIDPAQETAVSDSSTSVRVGRLQHLAQGDRIVLGVLLADRLAVVPAIRS